MRLTKLTSGLAVVGMSAGLCLVGGASAASAASTTIRPYVFNVIAVGQSDPGVWDNEACLIAADGTNPGDNGKINGVVVSGHSGELNVTYTGITSSLPVSTCVPVDITVSGSTTITPGTKPGGTLAVTTQSDVQGGIEASSVVTIDVSLSSGQVLKQPSGSALVSGSLTGPGTARLALKASTVKTKAVLNTSCADKVYVIDTNTHDDTKEAAPVATEWDGSTALTAGQYMATLRGCAADPANVPGKAITTKLSVSGDGAVSASFVKAATVNPATWDTTRGKTCKTVKTVATSGPDAGGSPIDASRVLQCKGDYGVSVAFSLDVRGWTTNSGEDPNGLNHPAAPTLLGSGTFTN